MVVVVVVVVVVASIFIGCGRRVNETGSECGE
jgi:hypothetical protein